MPATMTSQEVFDTALRILNEACRADPEALQKLIVDNRVPCNEQLTAHATVQVQCDESGGNCCVGLLGVVNGIVESVTGKLVAANFSEPDENGARRLLGFTEYKMKF